MCHQVLGKYAGKRLKSTCGWKGQDECECMNTIPYPGQHCGTGETDVVDESIDGDAESGNDSVFDIEDSTPEPKPLGDCGGIDDYGMRILPTGWADERGNLFYENDETVFWTTTHVYNDETQDIYTKKFKWDVCGVIQEAFCPGDRYSVRLVKDYTGGNHFETETIDGDNYNTILFPECKAVWTASNFASDKYPHSQSTYSENMVRAAYFIYVWNGNEWEKRALSEGETVVIKEGNEHCQYNIEYRVYMADACNQELVNTDDTVVMRVLDRVIPLIDEERERAISAETELAEAISAETEARIEADEVLQQEIEDEVNRAQQVEQELWDAINAEAEAREEVDQQLWDAINQEASARTEVDNQLWDAIAQEAAAREEVDNQQWDAINAEASARTEVDNQLWNAIAQEAAAREEVDNQQWEAIENEARIREEIDNQQWDAINAEIARAKAEEERIECQIIDNPADPMNDETPTQTAEIDGVKYFVLRANGGLTLVSKCGTNNIPIRLDSDFGTF
jgi:hypothetical protein